MMLWRCVLVTCAVLLLAVPGNAAEPDYDGLAELIQNSAGDTPAMCSAIRRLSAVLKNNPEDAELLRMRVNAYRSIGDYFSARKDAEKLASMFPGFTPYQMLRCMLRESTGVPEDEYLECYQKVLSSFGSESLRQKDPHGYILVLLLAKDPEAEKLRRQYSDALIRPSGSYDITREQLIHFDRRHIVPRVEPGTTWRNPCTGQPR